MSELYESLRKYADSDCLPMHMPGHKRRMGEMGNPYSVDITEIDGFDDLHHAEGLLLQAQKRAAGLYRSEETHYLINGSTAGILSAVSGCTTFGGTILMARNSHKSAYHAALLRGLHVSYVYPRSVGLLGINGMIFPEDVDKAFEKEPEIQAVLITSPTYDGVVSRVEEIAEIVHRHGVPLIVDEAHGAHLPFLEEFPRDSVSAGADVVIHSLHKTLPALTQTALIHLNGPLICREKIRKYLGIYQSSSPSYVLMAGLDQCVEWVREHRDCFISFYKELIRLRKKLSGMERLRLLKIPGMDPGKILVSVQGTGYSGKELSDLLRSEYRIELEMACSSYVCGITTVADTKKSLERLGDAFLETDQKIRNTYANKNQEDLILSDEVLPAERVCTFLEAEESEKELVTLTDCAGRIGGDFVSLYPPGIPVIAPGERITQEILERILLYCRQGLNLYGIDGRKIWVLKGTRRRDGENILPDGKKFVGEGYNL